MLFSLLKVNRRFGPEDGGDIFLRNIGWLSIDYTTLYPRSSTFLKEFCYFCTCYTQSFHDIVEVRISFFIKLYFSLQVSLWVSKCQGCGKKVLLSYFKYIGKIQQRTWVWFLVFGPKPKPRIWIWERSNPRVGVAVILSVHIRKVLGSHPTATVILKSSIFWNITTCSLLKFSRRFEGTCRLHLQNQLIWLILRPQRWRRQVPPKRSLTFNGLYSLVSQKIKFFITSAVRTPDPAKFFLAEAFRGFLQSLRLNDERVHWHRQPCTSAKKERNSARICFKFYQQSSITDHSCLSLPEALSTSVCDRTSSLKRPTFWLLFARCKLRIPLRQHRHWLYTIMVSLS
jgi:hypothetical protein